MSRKQVYAALKRAARNPNVPAPDQKLMLLAFSHLSGDWRPPIKKKPGFSCLGLIDGAWRQIRWEAYNWWSGDCQVRPERFHPLPMMEELS